MTQVNHQNFFSTSLSSNVNAGDTTTPLNSVPSMAAPFYLTYDATNVNGKPEVVLVTSKSSTNVNHAALKYPHTTAEVVKHAIVAEEIADLYNAATGGWNTESLAVNYGGADGSTGMFSLYGNKTGTYAQGMRLKYQQDHSLTAYWPFDSSSSDTKGGFNGTDTSMTYTPGKFSNAATFNGTTSKIVIADNASLKPTGEFTLGCWFKTGTTGANQQIFQSYSRNTNDAGIFLRVSTSNMLTFFSGKNTGNTTSDYTQLEGKTTVTDNTFHYAVVSFRNNYVQVYLDGKLEMSGYCLTPAYAATNYVRVGCSNSTGADAQFFNGQIDDLFLINGYALDQKTIKAKYDAGTAQGTAEIPVTKYGIISTDPTYAGGYTSITFWGGTDYSFANSAVSNLCYSMQNAFGFPIAQEKWSVSVVFNGLSQSSPGSGTAFNASAISIPIGSWNLMTQGVLRAIRSGGTYMNVTIGMSTANNTLADNTLKLVFPYTSLTDGVQNYTIQKPLTVTSKTSYYLNGSITTDGTPSNLYIYGISNSTLGEIRATSTLL